MTFDRRLQRQILEGLVATILAHAAELTELDRAIGDGDHGINLERGFRAVEKQLDALEAMPLGTALTEAGKRLVMTVGGASGPLYGTFFMEFGRVLAATDGPAGAPGAGGLTLERVVTAYDAAIAALKARGKSEAGQKTMLDVLIPVQAELHAAGPGLPKRLQERAASAARETIPMIALRGRASFLGERSAGHMDPGARSSELLIAAVCSSLQAAPQALT
jgi:dihydroxyacetone kinase-like protein